MSVEVYGYIHTVCFHLLDEVVYAARRYKTAHILDGYHVGAESYHLLSLVNEVLVGEYRVRVLFARLDFLRSEGSVFRVNGVANCAVCDTAVFLDIFDCRLNVVHVVKGVEDTHDVETGCNCVLAETFDDFVRVGSVTEKVTAAGECGKLRNVAYGSLYFFKPVPRVLTEVTHNGVWYCTAPYFHSVKFSVLVVWENAVHLCLSHTCCKCRLLTVTQRQVPYLKFSGHSFYVLILYEYLLYGNAYCSTNKGNSFL